MKGQNILKYIVLCLILCFSCTHQKNKILETKNETKNNSKTLKTSLLSLFKIKQNNSSLNLNYISNIDTTNGFRNVKLGLNIDSLDYFGFIVDSTLSDYGILKLIDTVIISENIRIGNQRINFVNLYFLNNKLQEINIEYSVNGSNGNDALSMLINIYGKPTNYKLIREKVLRKLEIENKEAEKYQNSTNSFMKGLHSLKNEEDIVLTNIFYE
jgi:hypothetical protein